MENKTVSGMLLTLLLICLSTLMFNIQPVRASGTTYIRADGSIDPTDAPISSTGNVTYTFMSDINKSIVVERDNIVVNGAHYMLQGAGNGTGMDLSGRCNITIMDMEIKAFEYGIWLNYSSSNIISGNNITDNSQGIVLFESSDNTISGNNITANNGWGIYLWLSSNNTISENNITANDNGVDLDSSSNNSVFGNSIAANKFGGILLPYSSSYNSVSGNTIANNEIGMRLSYSSNNNLTGNNITDNEYGIELFNSSKSILRDNSIADNRYNFGVWGWSLTGVMNDVDTSNTVDGKPVYYWINQSDKTVPLDAGYVALVNCTCITVQNLTLYNNTGAIVLAFTTNSTISRNYIANNSWGIGFFQSSNNTISGNTISNNFLGMKLEYSSDNNVFRNSITKNWVGIALHDSSNNSIYHNNFINNLQHQASTDGSVNVWDYGVEGNYWNDCDEVDADHDGIGDTPYSIDVKNRDNYPLMGVFHSFNTSAGYHVNVISNSTVEGFEYFEFNSTIRMYVSNTTATQTLGFCRICIPHALMSEPYHVTIDSAEPYYWNYTLYDDGDNRWIYFSYQHSTFEIIIVPEFPSFLILLLFMIATLLAVSNFQRRQQNWKTK